MPHIRRNHAIAKRSEINIYSTSQQYNTARRLNCNRNFDCNNYATINDCVGRNCDKFGDSVSCKFSVSHEQRLHSNTIPLPMSKTLDRHHEYAVPINCLKGSFQNFNISCEKMSETFECKEAKKFCLSNSNGSVQCTDDCENQCSGSDSLGRINVVSQSGGRSGATLPSGNNVYNFDNRQCNCSNSECGDDECNAKCEMNYTNSGNDRMPQAMWS